jgi:hypothetical protein
MKCALCSDVARRASATRNGHGTALKPVAVVQAKAETRSIAAANRHYHRR